MPLYTHRPASASGSGTSRSSYYFAAGDGEPRTLLGRRVDRSGTRQRQPPDGTSVCIGSQADVAHQIVRPLRAGPTRSRGGKPRKFKRVALAGHSAAGEISILEAYSYRDVKALVVVGFSFSNLAAAATIAFGNQRERLRMRRSGDPRRAALPLLRLLRPHRGRLPQHDVPQRAEGRRTRGHAPLPDPCGDNTRSIDRSRAGRAAAR